MNVIESKSVYEAWARAAAYLLTCNEHQDFNLIINISEPEYFDATDGKVRELFNEFLIENELKPLDTVANTIFPLAIYNSFGIDGVYNKYPDVIFPKIKLSKGSDWGRYAYRLVRIQSTDDKSKTIIDPETGLPVNPLEKIVAKLSNYKKNPKKAIYEMSLIDPMLDIAIYRPDRDRCFTMGGPCLSHISFKVIDEKVCLTAFYRSHYYIQKALGNFMGLAWLLYFVANESGLPIGSLTCHSSKAELESGTCKTESMRSIIANCNDLFEKSDREVITWERAIKIAS